MHKLQSLTRIITISSGDLCLLCICSNNRTGETDSPLVAMDMKMEQTRPKSVGALLEDIAVQLDNVEKMIKSNQLIMVRSLRK